MTRIIKLVFLGIVVITAYGCFPDFPMGYGHDKPAKEELELLDQLIGQPRKEVTETLGLPSKQLILDGQYYFFYRDLVNRYFVRADILFVPIPGTDSKTASGKVTQCLMIEVGSDDRVKKYIFDYIDSMVSSEECLNIYFYESELKRATFVLVNKHVKIKHVKIDIRPYSYSNHVDPASKEDISVAVLSETNLDARDVNPSTVVFGPAQAAISSLRAWRDDDVNEDGLRDRLFIFRISETGITCGDKEAILTGQTFQDFPIKGTDSVMTINCD